LLFAAVSFAQQAPAAEASQPAQRSAQQPADINQKFERPLAQESKAAEHRAEEKGENAQELMEKELKFGGPLLKWMSSQIHVEPARGYWIAVIFDFGLLAALIVFALKKNLPGMFRGRTKEIQREIQEARKASEEADRRLAEIESRLSRLDTEVASMRSAAEQDAAAEEQRILAAAEEEKQRIVTAAESEITAAAKFARRELKAFAADLAVNLAEQRIGAQVDAATDRALVRGFVGQLASGPGGSGGLGKDGQ
jgi:F-type H+-transporting ATPase subunit b